jgi:PHD/YefM family antitoxin component YafN of YafNO toxin-antitoxin module
MRSSAGRVRFNVRTVIGVPATMLDISEARKQLNSIDERLSDERVIYVTRHNKKAFAVVNLDYLSTLIETIEVLNDPEAMRMLQASLKDIRAGRLHDHKDVERELG